MLSYLEYDEELIKQHSLSQGSESSISNQYDELLRHGKEIQNAGLTPVVVVHIPTQRMMISSKEFVQGTLN